MRPAAPLILLALASAVVAQSPTTGPADAQLSALVEQLDDRDPEVRLAARSALMSLDRAALPKLRDVVAGTAPNTTRRAALRDVVRHVYLTGKHNFAGVNPHLGIMSIGGVAEPPTIGSRVIGFDAYRALRDGDVIVGVRTGGQPNGRFVNIESFQALRMALGRVRVGDWVGLRLLRDGTALELNVRLGPHPGVNDGSNPSQPEADRYWQRDFAPALAAPATTTAAQ